MQIYLQFEDKRADYTVLEIARLMCDLQHITIFALALAEEDLSSEYDPGRVKIASQACTWDRAG
jgi:hypothetical protein